MKFIIKHEIRGRMRIHMAQSRMTCRQADMLLYYIQSLEEVTEARVYERTGDAVIVFSGDRENIIKAVKVFDYDKVTVPDGYLEHSGRALNAEYREKLIMKVFFRIMRKLFLPWQLRAAFAAFRSIGYIARGISCLAKGKLKVEVLDATAIGVSLIRRDFSTAGSVMFLLTIGELLEEWTHKKSVGDLARSMSLNVSRVWRKEGGERVLVPSSHIKEEDLVVVHMGNVIPFDGTVTEGDAMINQASLTGEPLSVHKEAGGYVYAGTAVEEGEITIQVKAVSGSTRYEKIVTMIEESEKLKSKAESRAENLADRLVLYTFAGMGAIWVLTGNVTKALAVLMVDFSCALKLAMPIAVLSAIKEANEQDITVKGGKYMEAVAKGDVIVFDKTGTLTEARPVVKKVEAFRDSSEDELLRIAACLEEHFPHSMAKAVVNEAKARGLDHEEMHSKVNYIVAHGISSYIGEERVVIGSHHFVFEDEGCEIAPGYEERFEKLPDEYSHLYLAIDNTLAAVICIEDPLREEAPEVVRALKEAGFKETVMMTGDSERTAAAVAARVGVDTYYSEVLPEDKAGFIKKKREEGHTVIMIGDGINDSPALSAANAGIAISDGAEIAREIADITISADDLERILVLRRLSRLLMNRIRKNYRMIVGINAALIALGVGGVIQPSMSALLHNMSTLCISMENMTGLLK